MPLKPGTRLGPHEILSLLGAGGMGEVYKARDTRLDRTVAIKVLHAHLADNPSLRERFQREAETIASLKHPHICVLYDIGQERLPQGSTDYLVMEYLEGETLAARLLKGPLPLDQALQFAIEIADALDKAHRKGVTHRDLKPGNIMLVKDGATTSTKLLDFGLAKLKQDAAMPAPLPPLGPDDPTPPLATKPAVQPRSPTALGTVLGTWQYMSPEQAEGDNDTIDARTDIFAFGALVYEMVTGRKAFEGKSQASLIAKILESDPPPMSSLVPVTPPALDRVVKRCLAKDKEARWQSAADLCAELQWIQQSRDREGADGSHGQSAVSIDRGPVRYRWKRRLAFSIAGLLAWALTALLIWYIRQPAPQPVSRLTISLPPGQHLTALDQPAVAISPDGKNIVYVAAQTGISGGPVGRQELYLRPLDSSDAKPIAGTEGAAAPFFSPDGQWIGFFADGKLKKISVSGGSAVALAIAPNPGGANWSSQGILAFQGNATASWGLQQVFSEGGAPQQLTRLANGETFQRWPELLPGGKGVLYASSAATSTWSNAHVAAQTSGGGEPRNLGQGAQPRYAISGHLLYSQSGTLMAAPFDVPQLRLAGVTVPALEGVMQSAVTGAAQYSISSTGTLIYLAGGITGSQSRLAWVSRNGEEQLLPAAPHNYTFPRVSPDGHRVAVNISEQESQIWVYDVFRDTLTRLTFEGNVNNVPAWSSDGERIAFNSNREGAAQNLFWQPADGSGGGERLTKSENLNSASSVSPDGQLLAYTETTPETGRDIWILNLRDHKTQPFLKTPFEDTAAKFSPDGKWLAYSSDESGRREIYVQPYPGPGGKWQISTDGGQEPVWNPKSGELFYRSGTKVMEVDVDTKSGFSAGKPRMLFDGPYLRTTASIPYYDISPDGQRFLMLKPVESQTTAPTQINVVLNWFEELKRKVPVK